MSNANHANVDVSAQKRFILREAIQDATAAVTVGVLSSSSTLAAAESAPLRKHGNTANSNVAAYAGDGHCFGSYIPASTRLQGLSEGTKRVKKLLAEYEQAALTNIEKEIASQRVAPSAAQPLTDYGSSESLVAVRAFNSQKLFAEHCKLEVPSKEFVVPANYFAAVASAVANGQGAASADPAVDKVSVDSRLKPLVQVLGDVKEAATSTGFAYEQQLKERTERANNKNNNSRAGGGANTSAVLMYHMPIVVKRLGDVIEDTIEKWRHGVANCPKSSAIIQEVAGWPQPLLRLMNECLSNDSLETMTESSFEQLRRVKFDVEELQHEQEQAVTDGDMQKSEELYFQQASILETMKPYFEKLEGIIEHYKHDYVAKPREELKNFQRSFGSQCQQLTRNQEQLLRRTQDDMKKLGTQKEKVAHLRVEQKSGISLYTTEWNRLYDSNVAQQNECLRAMAQIEKRLKDLAQEQTFLVEDRLERIQEERQRCEDTATFMCFADGRQDVLKRTEVNVAQTVDALKQLSGVIEFSCGHVDAYLRDVIQPNAEDTLLRVRKDRLEQFRTLYLTLGDLQFKKSRHAEEVQKKVEYYELQQEIAMDTLNPKAKEFSQARKKWQSVQEEVESQLTGLSERSEQQVVDFKPTEQLLIAAGVEFVHPEEELARRNNVRVQKLLEYQQLMDTTVEKNNKNSGGTTAEDDMKRAEEIMQEDMKMLAAHVPKLQATENGTSAAGSPLLGSASPPVRRKK